MVSVEDERASRYGRDSDIRKKPSLLYIVNGNFFILKS